MTIYTKNEAETEQAGAELARTLPDGAVVALYGDLGAGKTAFVRGMARGMGISARVSSPTFTIVNEYLSGARCRCIHFDMYRLGSVGRAVRHRLGGLSPRAAASAPWSGAKTSRTPLRATRSPSASKSSATRKERSRSGKGSKKTMLILGLESSAKAASAALSRDGALLGQNYQCAGLTHSRTLLPMAEQLLAETGLTLRDIDAVAVSRGPGSFTGIRIGVSTAKGLCWGAEKPAIGVSTLEAMGVERGERAGGQPHLLRDGRTAQPDL